jgi:hypothetical protein
VIFAAGLSSAFASLADLSFKASSKEPPESSEHAASSVRLASMATAVPNNRLDLTVQNLRLSLALVKEDAREPDEGAWRKCDSGHTRPCIRLGYLPGKDQ